MKTNFLMVLGLSWWLSAGTTSVLGMDRWSALSLIESGNNDAAIGHAGEVSRFQIKPVLWAKYCQPYSVTARTNPRVARHAAQAIMNLRCLAFEHQFQRLPNNFEYYVLWNAPAQIRKPSKAVSERARRFSHLVGPDRSPQGGGKLFAKV